MQRFEPGTASTEVLILEGGLAHRLDDEVASEEPLEVFVRWRGGLEPLAVTMRTPGADAELAVGFLHAEGVVRSRRDVTRTEQPSRGSRAPVAIVVELADGVDVALAPRRFVTTSACGVCSVATLADLPPPAPPARTAGERLDPALLYRLPARLRAAQGIFRATGGLHAAALFDARGELIALREDVGRHNALDKLVGWALLEDRLPLHGSIVMVSGRASYELVQKCAMAQAPVLCAVSAPSSLAVAVARRFGLTLVGFLREQRFNVYSGTERIAYEGERPPSSG